MRIDTTGSTQITIPNFVQISTTHDSVVLDLAGQSLQIVQDGPRITIQMNPLLAFTAPEARGEVAREKGIEPYEYIRLEP